MMDLRTHYPDNGIFFVPTDRANPSEAGHGPIFAIHRGSMYRLVPVDKPEGKPTRTNQAAWAVRNGWPDCVRRERVNAWITNMWFMAGRDRSG